LLRLFEKYLTRLGENRGMLLLATVLVWVSILLAVFVYALGVGALAVAQVSQNAYQAIVEIATDRAYGGDPWAIFFGAAAWIALILLIFPMRAALHLWREYRRQERAAQKALTQVEARIFPPDRRSSNVHSPMERLARRSLDEIETTVLGEPQPADLTIEERIIRVDVGGANPEKVDPSN